jgi:hypothetical protein
MHSGNFKLFADAVLKRKQITCWYDNHYREVCPHIVGHKAGMEKAQVYQFGGTSSRPLPREGRFKCFDLNKVEQAALRDGPWHGPEKHKHKQQCVDEIYVHVDLSVTDQPGRRR